MGIHKQQEEITMYLIFLAPLYQQIHYRQATYQVQRQFCYLWYYRDFTQKLTKVLKTLFQKTLFKILISKFYYKLLSRSSFCTICILCTDGKFLGLLSLLVIESFRIGKNTKILLDLIFN